MSAERVGTWSGWSPRIAWIVAALVTFGVALLFVFGRGVNPDSALEVVASALFGAIPITFVVTAAAILSRQPRNMVGWTLMVPAVGIVASELVSISLESLQSAPATVGFWTLFPLMVDNFSWVLLIFPIFHLLLVFPDGRLLTGRWLSVVWLEGAMILTMAVLSVFTVEIGPLDSDAWTVPNPIGFIPIDFFSGRFAVVWSIGLIVMTLSGVLALIVRFRRARNLERQQIKWMLFAVLNFGVIYSLAAAETGLSLNGLTDVMLGLAINFLAVSIAFGVLKYRLFDIDRFISRTVGYAVVSGLLILVYVGLAVWLPSRFVAGDSPIFVAGATLAVAALFSPLRQAVLRWVDRRFYRSRYDTELLVEDFANRLQNRTDVGELTDDWVDVVNGTLQPSAIGVWIKG